MPLIEHRHLQGNVPPIPITRGRIGIRVEEMARLAAMKTADLQIFPDVSNRTLRAGRCRGLAACLLHIKTNMSQNEIATAIGANTRTTVYLLLRTVKPTDDDFLHALELFDGMQIQRVA